MNRSFLARVAIAALLAAGLASCVQSSRSERTGEVGVASIVGPSTSQDLIAQYNALADSILDARKQEATIVRKILAATHKRAEAAYESAQASLKAGDQPAAARSIEELATLVAQLGTEGDASVAAVRKRLIEGGHHFNPIHGTGHAAGGQPAHHAEGQKPAHHAAGQSLGQNDGQKPEGASAAGKSPASGGQTAHAASPGAPEGGAQHQGGGSHGIGYEPGFVIISRATKKALIDSSHAMARLSTAPAADALGVEWTKVETVWAEIEKGAP